MKNFSSAWAYTGSTNLRLSNVEDHARGNAHKRTMDLHLAEDKRLVSSSSQPASNMQAGDLAKTEVKFELAYFMAKELPLPKYPELLKLVAKHKVNIGDSYLNRISCNTFLNYISADLAQKLEKKLTNGTF